MVTLPEHLQKALKDTEKSELAASLDAAVAAYLTRGADQSEQAAAVAEEAAGHLSLWPPWLLPPYASADPLEPLYLVASSNTVLLAKRVIIFVTLGSTLALCLPGSF